MPDGLSEYVKKLQAYLNNQVALGVMSTDQMLQIWQDASTRASRGGLVSDLPYYKEASSIWLKPTTPTYPRTVGRAGYEHIGQYEAVQKEAQAQMVRQPGETALERLKRLEVWLSQAKQFTDKSPQQQQSWMAVANEVTAIERSLGEEGLRLEEEYGAGTFERERAALTGPKHWRDWYESKYGRELGRFKATLSPGEQLPGKSWAEYLKERKPELKEEFASLGAYRRGERPWDYQPRIKMVKF